MVLNKAFKITHALMLGAMISACSIKTFKPAPPIVPVPSPSSETPSESSKPKRLNILNSPTAQPPAKQVENKQETAPPEPELKDAQPSREADSILPVLLAKADRAMNAQQWLRAQRVLEQALRIEPKNPIIFDRYGELYLLMGAQDKAKSMYQRALYLASDGSHLKREIEERLETLEETLR